MANSSVYYGGSGTDIVSGAPTTAQWNTLVAAFETLQDKFTALETAVGDEDSGLVKDVSDLATVIGNSDAGLVKRVSDLELAAQTAGGGGEE